MRIKSGNSSGWFQREYLFLNCSLFSHVQLFCDPMDCSPSSSSVHGIPPGKNTGVGCHSLFQGGWVFPTQGLNLGLPHGKEILYQLSHQGSPLYSLLSEKILHCLLCLNILKKSLYSFMGGSGGWILKWPGNAVVLFGSSPFVLVESVFSKELSACSKASWHVAWCWLGTDANQGKDGALGSQVAGHSWT